MSSPRPPIHMEPFGLLGLFDCWVVGLLGCWAFGTRQLAQEVGLAPFVARRAPKLVVRLKLGGAPKLAVAV